MIVKAMLDSALRMKGTLVQSLQIAVHRTEIEQAHAAHFARSVDDILIQAIFCHVSMRFAISERSFHAFSMCLVGWRHD
jgi:hypothetical protein